MPYSNFFNTYDIGLGVDTLGANQLAQVNNIGALSIPFLNWQYLADMDQFISTNATVQFNSITDGTLTITNGEISNATNLMAMEMTGWCGWTGAGNLWSISSDQFTLERGGTGYIKSNLVEFSGSQTVTMIQFDINLIYIDSSGILQRTDTISRELFLNNIVLFEVFYNGGTFVKRENHKCGFQASISNYLHDAIGSIIEGSGGNIGILSSTEINITASAELDDHGIMTDIIGSPDALTFNFFYLDVSGNWIINSTTSTFPSLYNPAGTPVALSTGAKWGVYRLYAFLDSGNSIHPTYGAVINTVEYNNSTSVSDAISLGNIQGATKNLASMEPVQLGYVIFKNSGIQSVVIAKSTLNQQYAGGSSVSSHLVLSDLNVGTYGLGGHTGACQRHIETSTTPTVNDDITAYLENCIWLNQATNKTYICVDNTLGTAIWKELLKTDDDIVVNSINTITSAELAYLDGLDQFLNTTSDPTFNSLTLTTSISLPGTINVDIINENTLNNGVIIEGITIKDSIIGASSYSLNMGISSTVSGDYTISVGAFGGATADAVRVGYTCYGYDESVAIGKNNKAHNASIAIGRNCMQAGTTSNQFDIAIGAGALYSLTGGTYNVGIGYVSGSNLTTGDYNTFCGYYSGRGVTTGNYNCSFGNNLNLLSASSYNILMGNNNYANSSDISIGQNLNNASYSGVFNTYVGSNIGSSATSASSNVAIGVGQYGGSFYFPLYSVTSGQHNICFGTGAGSNITTGNYNFAAGIFSNVGAAKISQIALGDSSSADGTGATAVGSEAKARNDNDVSVGRLSGATTSTGNNTIVGSNAGNGCTGSYCTVLGAGANCISNSCLVGGRSAYCGGFNSIAFGYGAQANNNESIAIGTSAISGARYAISIGEDCTTAGVRSIAMGYDNYAEDYNIMIGDSNSSSSITGARNIGIGQGNLTACTSGCDNIAIGDRNLYNTTTGYINVAIGKFNYVGALPDYCVLMGYANNSLGDKGIAIGYNNHVSGTGICLGNSCSATTNGFAVGNSVSAGNNEIYLGNSSITSFKCQVALTVVSDKRYKKNIKPLKEGLEFINQLNPVEYQLNDDPDDKTRYGLIAQEVQEINPAYVNDKNEDKLGITYQNFIPALINSVKELKRIVKVQGRRINILEKKLYTNIIYPDKLKDGWSINKTI